jgi:ribosomal protein L34
MGFLQNGVEVKKTWVHSKLVRSRKHGFTSSWWGQESIGSLQVGEEVKKAWVHLKLVPRSRKHGFISKWCGGLENKGLHIHSPYAFMA